MPKLSTSGAVLEHELSEFRLVVERQTGVLLDPPREALTAAVARFVETHRPGCASDLLTILRSSDSACEEFVEDLLDGETGFFRHPAAFDALVRIALPEILGRESGEAPRGLRVWSAGCSTGEEAYSLAISICETVNCSIGGWKVDIVASDIRRHALQFAERGLFDESAVSGVPKTLLQRYFVRVGQHRMVKPRIRNLVRFAPMNLARPVYIGRFDGIFCMDVLPRFSMTQRVALVQRLHCYLQPGGYLFLGEGEKLPAVGVTFSWQRQADYVVYRKPLAAAAGQGR